MKTIYSTILTLLCAIPLQAQQLQARLSSELKIEKSIFYDEIIGRSGNNIYALATKLVKKPIEGDLYAEFMIIDAKTMAVTSIVPVVVPDKKTTLLATRVIKGQPWIFTRTSSRKADVDFIKAYKLNATTGETNLKEYPIAEFIDKKNLKISTWLPVSASAYILHSPDSTKIALVSEANTESKELNKLYVKILEANTMTPLSEQYITIPFSKNQYRTGRFLLTNKGSFQLIGKMYDTEKCKESISKTEAAYKYVLYDFDGTNTKGNDYILDLGGKFIHDIIYTVRPDNGNIAIAGLYSDQKNKIVNGLYYMEIEKNTGMVVNKYMTTIASDKIKYAPKDILKKKENGLVEAAAMDDVFFKKNGDLMFVINTEERVYKTDAQGRTISSFLTTNGSVALGVSQKGDMQWATAIARDYNSSLRDVVAAKIFLKNDCIFMVYNDSENNAKTPLDEKIKHTHSNNKKNATVLVKIDGNGKMSRKMLLSEQILDGFYIKTTDGIPMNDNEYVFAARKYNLLKGTLTVKMCRMTFAD